MVLVPTFNLICLVFCNLWVPSSIFCLSQFLFLNNVHLPKYKSLLQWAINIWTYFYFWNTGITFNFLTALIWTLLVDQQMIRNKIILVFSLAIWFLSSAKTFTNQTLILFFFIISIYFIFLGFISSHQIFKSQIFRTNQTVENFVFWWGLKTHQTLNQLGQKYQVWIIAWHILQFTKSYSYFKIFASMALLDKWIV